jgi:hypothetical protein
MSATIHSVCVRPQHRARGTGERILTVHHGEWAFCPDGAEGEHDWKPIEPVTLDELVLAVRSQDPASVGVA